MAVIQTIKEYLTHYSDQIKILLFGESNSRLDKLIFSFYNMREEKRVLVTRIGYLVGVLSFTTILSLYFYGLFKLQKTLDHATEAYLQVQEFKPSFILAQNEYTQLALSIQKENSPTTVITAVNQVANATSLHIDGLPQTPTLINLPSTSDLSTQFQKAKIDFQISGVSLKKLVDFLNKVHKLPNKFSITKLEILQTLDNKLYFNVAISLEAYIPKQKG